MPRRRISLSMRQVGGAMPRPATEIEEEAADAAGAGRRSGPGFAPIGAARFDGRRGRSSGRRTDGGAESGAAAAPAPRSRRVRRGEAEASSGDSSTVEAAPSTDDAVDEEPAATAAEATAGDGTTEEGEQSEEDISLEAILEDLKRREGRTG